MYEAGAIDGIRNRWQELRYITLPFNVAYAAFQLRLCRFKAAFQ